MSTAAARLLCSVDEAAAMLGGVGRTTLYQLMRDHELERVKIGRKTLVTVDSIERYVERLKAIADAVPLWDGPVTW